MALNVISISAERLAAYVVAESRTGRPMVATDCRRLTECEAFLLRLGRKPAGLEGFAGERFSRLRQQMIIGTGIRRSEFEDLACERASDFGFE
jgi:hypothetical protein